jgi:hypothetical protein
VTGEVSLPDGTEMVMPGDNISEMDVELIAPIAMDEASAFCNPRRRPHRRCRRRRKDHRVIDDRIGNGVSLPVTLIVNAKRAARRVLFLAAPPFRSSGSR